MNPIGPVNGASNVQSIIAMRDAALERSKLLRELQESKTQPTGVPTGVPATQPTGATSFIDTLDGALGSVNASQQKSAAITEAYERGEVTDVAKVMLARQEAGVAFEATLQVRNKLLSAYQEIMRMGV